MTNEIIIVKQLPEIVEQLHTIKDEIKQRVDDALSLDCSENTVKQVKIVRADLRKDFDSLESKRKEVKKKILSPYEQFEQIYKDCVTNIFKPADSQLSAKISEVENGLKEQKKTEILEYFEELKTAKGIDFVTFEDTGAVVTLSASKKSLKEKVKAFLDKVSDDFEMIDTQEFAPEILVEYKKSLNVSQAIIMVNNRHKAIEEEQKRTEAAKIMREKQSAAEKQIDEIVEKEQPLNSPEEVPDSQAELPKEFTLIEPEKLYKMPFEAEGTMEQLRQLKYFALENLGINLRKIKNYEV